MSKFLKFSFFIFFSFLTISCSSDDDNNGVYSPPDWLIGTWTNDSIEDGTILIKTIIASKNDIVLISGDGTRKSLSNETREREQPPEESLLEADRYVIFTGIVYEFFMISDNEIKIDEKIYTRS